MTFSDLLDVLEEEGLDVSHSQLRWPITTKKIERPRLDGSLRFDFNEKNVAEVVEYFKKKRNSILA